MPHHRTPEATIQEMRRNIVIPVIRTSRAQTALTAVEWLSAAGFRLFEITLTIPGASEVIAQLSQNEGMMIGAGTVPNAEAAQRCLAAGARFLVAPWVDASLVPPAHAKGAAVLLGAMTPGEVRAAVVAGADAVKIFPAASAGGAAHIRALTSVFPGIAFVPTGGVDATTMDQYLDAGAAFVGIGGRLVDEGLIEAGDRSAVLDIATRVLTRITARNQS